MTDKNKLAKLMSDQVAGHYGKPYDQCPKNDDELKKLFRKGLADINEPTQVDHLYAMIDVIEVITSSGYAIVKRVPDEKMLEAGEIWHDGGGASGLSEYERKENVANIFDAMLENGEVK